MLYKFFFRKIPTLYLQLAPLKIYKLDIVEIPDLHIIIYTGSIEKSKIEKIRILDLVSCLITQRKEV